MFFFEKMLAADQGKKEITTQTVNPNQEFLLEDSNGTANHNGYHNHGIPPIINSDSLILNLPDQVHQGLEWVREAAQELGRQLTRRDRPNRRTAGTDLPAEDVAVPLLDLMALHDRIPKFVAILGFAEDGDTVLHHFDSTETPHLLVVGGPGAGKSVMLRAIAASLALNNRQSDIQLAAICPITGDEEKQRKQASSWYALNYLPHMLCDIAFKHSDIVDLLTFLRNEIPYREKHSFEHPRMIVLIDQVDELIARGGRRCAEPILRLAQKGEAVGIHMVLTAQSLESNTLSTQLLKELPTRLIGRPPNIPSGQNDLLNRQEEIEQLLGEGDFLHQQNGRVRRIQGAFIGDQELIPRIIDMNRHRAILLANPAQSRLRLEKTASESGGKRLSNSIDQVPVQVT